MYLKSGQLPDDDKVARKIMLQSNDFLIIDCILYHLYYRSGKGHSSELASIQSALPDCMVYQTLVEMYDTPLLHGFRGNWEQCPAKTEMEEENR